MTFHVTTAMREPTLVAAGACARRRPVRCRGEPVPRRLLPARRAPAHPVTSCRRSTPADADTVGHPAELTLAELVAARVDARPQHRCNRARVPLRRRPRRCRPPVPATRRGTPRATLTVEQHTAAQSAAQTATGTVDTTATSAAPATGTSPSPHRRSGVSTLRSLDSVHLIDHQPRSPVAPVAAVAALRATPATGCTLPSRRSVTTATATPTSALPSQQFEHAAVGDPPT